MSKNESVAGVVVFFKPNNNAIENLKKIAAQMDHTYVICNSPLETESDSALQIPHVEFSWNPSNRGLGAALNQGVESALAAGFDFIFTFDQDTEIFQTFRSSMMQSHVALRDNQKLGVIVPRYSSNTSADSASTEDKGSFAVTTGVQSGMMFTRNCLEEVGPFRDDFFIEGIDTEYCLRARRNGYINICGGEVLMIHGAGDYDVRTLMGRSVVVTNHSPYRVYLQFRNFTFILKSYFYRESVWGVKSLMSMVKKLILIIAFEDLKKAKLRAALKGIASGLLSKQSFNNDNVKF